MLSLITILLDALTLFISLFIQSIEIQKRIGAFSMALDTINKCLSEAICAFSRGRSDGESRTASLIHSGNEILEMDKYSSEVRFVDTTIFCSHYLLCVLMLARLKFK